MPKGLVPGASALSVSLECLHESPDPGASIFMPLPEGAMPTFIPPNDRCSFSPPSGRIPPLPSSPWVVVLSAPPVSGSAIYVPLGIYCPGLEKGSPPDPRSCDSAESPCGEKRDPQYTPGLWGKHQKSFRLDRSP